MIRRGVVHADRPSRGNRHTCLGAVRCGEAEGRRLIKGCNNLLTIAKSTHLACLGNWLARGSREREGRSFNWLRFAYVFIGVEWTPITPPGQTTNIKYTR